ncbi:hypothetical protein [Actinomycetospora straminea]|uniref:YbaB/EbfC DNA-binding family protein n=1 Tax=Actinomycetospora straminea TaxID=663607 RepID=A0ABP9E468_9PSEU|nr:hypothetical protein [Actinomycetospora straminea]MDD7930932.1 hypothetical protein [Actinomycetospora straminea]
MSAPPRGGYAAWVSWLEAFRRGEDPSTAGLGPVRGGFGSYVEARLLERLSAAFAERVRQWQTALGDRIVAQPPDGPVAAAAILQDAVVRLEPLVRLADSPLVPRTLGVSMHDMLHTVRDGARAALDEAWRRGLEDQHAPGMPAQRRVDPARLAAARTLPGAVTGAVPAPRPGFRRN